MDGVDVAEWAGVTFARFQNEAIADTHFRTADAPARVPHLGVDCRRVQATGAVSDECNLFMCTDCI